MYSFIICGIFFLLYSYISFKKDKIIFPSIIFSVMWGANCVFTFLILSGAFERLYLEDYYHYEYVDIYIIYFTIASILAFSLAHKLSGDCKVKIRFSEKFLEKILTTYSWIMWLNFFGGLLRIVLMVQLVGFDNMMDYRLAANSVMMYGGSGFIGIVFRLTAYVQMFANFYVGLTGFQTGFRKLEFKSILKIFILYAPTQLATGGRLFILYFILFYFGAFLLGRGLSFKNTSKPLLLKSEIRSLLISFIGLLSLVSIIALARYDDGVQSKESPFAKFTYITEGMLATEHCMKFYNYDQFTPDYGKYLFTGKSTLMASYTIELQKTHMSSIVHCVMTPLYLGFGFYGSILVWFIIAFLVEFISIKCLNKFNIVNFFIFITLLKTFYESIMSVPINNLPVFQLIVLLYIFYKPIFGQYSPTK